MKIGKIASGFMAAGGVVEIIIGVIHFIWPFVLINHGLMHQMSVDYRNILVLSSLAIGVCVTLFGLLSIYFSRRLIRGERSARVFGISQGLLWMIRAALEVAYPVTIPLFFITRPTIFVLPMSILIGLMYLVPLLLVGREFPKDGGAKEK